MASKHLLQLDIPTCTNEGILLVDDISVYDSLLPVGALNVQITPPGYNQPASLLPTDTRFRLVLTACSIGISGVNDCSSMLPALPDGLWDIRYSIAPNDKVYVSYKMLRIVKAYNRYINLLCDLSLPCCLPDQETEYQVKELDYIHNLLISAKNTVEVQHNLEDGINQLRYANTLMDKMSTRKPFC